MSNLHPMSEKPKPNVIVKIVFQDDGHSLFDVVRTKMVDDGIMIAQSLECFGDTIFWNEYIDNNTSLEDNFKPKGWRYLNETIEPEWEGIDLLTLRAVIGCFEVRVHNNIHVYRWEIVAVNRLMSESVVLVSGSTEGDIESAQTAALDCYNKTFANKPEARMKS